MHILLAVLGAIAAAFWAFTHFVGAAREGRDAIRDVQGAFRGAKWSKRVGQRLIESLSDPREAAAVLLFQVAAYDGAVTDRQHRLIVDEMKKAFAADSQTAEEFFAFARAATGEIHDAANSLRKILKPVETACSLDERRQLIDMLLTVAECEGPVTDVQNRLIAEARRILLPPA